VELISSVLAITALLVNKIVHDQHADNKEVDRLEKRLANGHDHQPDDTPE